MGDATSTHCYGSSNSTNDNSIYQSDYLPCNIPSITGFVSCCFKGHTCGLDGFCQANSTPLPGTTGYYLGGCTDPTYKDQSCVQQCSDFPLQDVSYNTTNQHWACCYSNPSTSRNCSSPLNNVTFSAPSPNVLFAKQFSVLTAAATQTSTSAIPAATSITSSTNTPTATILNTLNGGVSPSAVAGIAVGVGIAGIFIGVLLALILLRHRLLGQDKSPAQLNPAVYYSPKTHYPNRAEMQHNDEAFHRTRQLDSVTSTAFISELPGRNLESRSNGKT